MRNSLAGAVAAFALISSSCSGGSSGDEPGTSRRVDAERSSLSAAPATATADGASAVTLTATARDASGTAFAGKTVVFTVTGTGNQLSAASAATDANGVATVALSSTKA